MLLSDFYIVLAIASTGLLRENHRRVVINHVTWKGIVTVPAGAVAGSRAIVSLPDDGDARHATVTIAFPPGLSTGQELTVALEV